MTLPKYQRVAASVRTRIADGILQPGEAAPSAAALARSTGTSALTCRKALRTLIEEGTLAPGLSRNARPRVPASAGTPPERSLADAERALSASLAARRRAFGLTQVQFAATLGVRDDGWTCRDRPPVAVSALLGEGRCGAGRPR
jgi:DNA-binding transcriptional regulator YhcF (GntR family)